MKYIKKEEDDEQEVSMESTFSDPFNRDNNRNFVDLATPPALNRIILNERKKRKKSIKKHTTRSKPRKKTSIDSTESALLRYKLRFVNDSTQNYIARLKRQYKEPTDKLFNKYYTNKNANQLGSKFNRRLNNKLNIIENEELSKLIAFKSNRGNVSKMYRNTDTQTKTETQTETEPDTQRQTEPGAQTDRDVNDDNPPFGVNELLSSFAERDDENVVTVQIEEMNINDISEAQDYDTLLNKLKTEIKDVYEEAYYPEKMSNQKLGHIKTIQDAYRIQAEIENDIAEDEQEVLRIEPTEVDNFMNILKEEGELNDEQLEDIKEGIIEELDFGSPGYQLDDMLNAMRPNGDQMVTEEDIINAIRHFPERETEIIDVAVKYEFIDENKVLPEQRRRGLVPRNITGSPKRVKFRKSKN